MEFWLFLKKILAKSHKKLARSWSTTTAHNLWLTAISNAKNLETGVRTTIPERKITYLNFKRHFEWLGGVFIFIYFLHFGFCWHLLYAYSSYHPFRLQCGILFFCLTMNNKLESDKKRWDAKLYAPKEFPNHIIPILKLSFLPLM